VPANPIAHVCEGSAPQIASIAMCDAWKGCDQLLPSKRRTPEPPAHSSLDVAANNAYTGLALAPETGDHGVPSGCVRDQVEPSKCSSVPSSPAAQTLFEDVPVMTLSALSVPDATTDQSAPFQCSNVPPSPAAQTSAGAAPQMADKVICLGMPATKHQWSELHPASAAVCGSAELGFEAAAAVAVGAWADGACDAPHAVSAEAIATDTKERTEGCRVAIIGVIVEQLFEPRSSAVSPFKGKLMGVTKSVACPWASKTLDENRRTSSERYHVPKRSLKHHRLDACSAE
jgi:hypothetical protein